MNTFPVYLVFYFGGAIFANFVLTRIFLFLAVAVTLAYLAYNVAINGHFGAAVISALIAFVCIQLGYVSGLGLKTLYANFFPDRPVRSPYQDLGKEETKVK